MELIAELMPMLLVVFIISLGLFKKIKVFSVFTKGAKKAFATSLSVLPTLIGIITAITMFQKSGLLDFLVELANPLCQVLKMPKEILPLAILKPISGSGSTALVINIFENFGTDSIVGKMASVLASSSETSIYTVTVYFAVCKCKNSSYSLPVALTGDILAVILTVITVNFIG